MERLALSATLSCNPDSTMVRSSMNRYMRKMRTWNRLATAACCVGAVSVGVIAAAFGENLLPATLFMSCGILAAWSFVCMSLETPYCVIHPYFSKKLSTDLPCTAFGGKAIAAHLDVMDEYLRAQGLPGISDFGFQQVRFEKMHAPNDVLLSLGKIVDSGQFSDSELRRELGEWIEKIRIARDEGSRVAIHMRVVDAVSDCEIDRLQGTY